MKNVLALTLFAATTLPAVTQAQIVYRPQYLWLPVNQLQNPGFENYPSSAPWDASGAYVYSHSDAQTIYTYLGGSTPSYHHTGSRAFNFGIGQGTYSNDFYSPVRQTLATPLAGNLVFNASVWVYSEGQYLDLKIKYTDNTFTKVTYYTDGATHPQQTNGWRQWDFTSSINPNKTVAGLEFSVSAGMFYPYNVVIDDVTISKLVRFNYF